jgi:hypothetical protein
MPATQKRRGPSTHVAAGPDVAPAAAQEVAPAAAEPLLERIAHEAAMQIRRQLSLAEGARLPYGIKHLIDVAARDVVESAVEVTVAREVRGAAGRLARTLRRGYDEVTTPSDLPLLEEGLSLRSPEVPDPLLEKAKDLAAKKNALEAAGFSSEEAMQILVAEITTVGH